MTRIETVVQTDDSPIRSPDRSYQRRIVTSWEKRRAEQSGLWREQKTGDLDTALRQLNAKMGSSATKKTVVEVEPWSRIPERRQAWVEVTSR